MISEPTLRCGYTHVHRLTDVSNCSISHPGCILQNQLSSPAEADYFYGPPNEMQVLLGSQAIPQNKLFLLHCCSGILLTEMLWIANLGGYTSLSPFQPALAEHLPPCPAQQCQRCSLLLFTPQAHFSKGLIFFLLFQVLFLNLKKVGAGLELD